MAVHRSRTTGFLEFVAFISHMRLTTSLAHCPYYSVRPELPACGLVLVFRIGMLSAVLTLYDQSK
jgi:hypothetical protein